MAEENEKSMKETLSKIIGYTERSSAAHAIDLVNVTKEIENHLGDWVQKLRADDSIDQRWVSIAITDFQKGFMALNRAVFQPTSRLK